MTLRIGFTGTRLGMTEAQQNAVKVLLRQLFPAASAVHQGCCVGADEQFAWLVSELHPYMDIKGWPSTIDHLVSRKACMCCDEIHQPQPALVRNRCIVDAVDVLIAAPAEAVEQVRGGTWSTVRYARKQGKHIYLVLPDGGVTEEQPRS
jgi:hypothetical protein